MTSAAEIFQNEIEQCLQGLDGTMNISDDILVFGKDTADHDKNLYAACDRLHENNITLNPEKCEYGKASVDFFGHTLSAEGIKPDKKKVEAIQNAQAPKDRSELASFLGLVNYVAQFIPDLVSIVDPLRQLNKKDVPWHWGTEQDTAMETLKDRIVSSTVYFACNQPVELLVDASPTGLGAILAQEHGVVAYA